MGTGYHGGFGNTEGSKQTPGTETQADLIAQLKMRGTKISEQDVVFSSGEIEYSRLVNKNGREGYEKLYRYKNQYYLLTGVGTNGFIVTSYPIDSASARKLKERYGK